MGIIGDIIIGAIAGWILGAVVETADEVHGDPPDWWLDLLHGPSTIMGGIIAIIGLILYGAGVVSLGTMLALLAIWPGMIIGAYVWSFIYAILSKLAG